MLGAVTVTDSHEAELALGEPLPPAAQQQLATGGAVVLEIGAADGP